MKKLILILVLISTGCQTQSLQPTLVSIAMQSGNAYYVSVSGSDSNPGTQSLPWKTIQKCLNQVQPGWACQIMAGTYNESLALKTSGTASARITLKNYNNQTVTVNSGSSLTVYTSGNISYYTIDGLRLISTATASGQNDVSIDISKNVNNRDGYPNDGNNGFVLSNCYVEGAILIFGHNNVVENCEFNGKGTWYNGIHDRMAASHDNTYQNNMIHDYITRGVWTMQNTSNITIEGNTIYNVENGIDCDGAYVAVTNCVVRKNTIHDTHGVGLGMQLEDAFEAVVDSNKVYNTSRGIFISNYGVNSSDGWSAVQEYRNLATNMQITNNQISNSSIGIFCYGALGITAVGNVISAASTDGIQLTHYDNYFCDNWVIKSNTISGSNMWVDASNTPHLASDYNIYSSGVKFYWRAYDTSMGYAASTYTLTQLQSVKQLELHSSVVN